MASDRWFRRAAGSVRRRDRRSHAGRGGGHSRPGPDYDVYPIPARPALPGPGNTYIDPTFGTEVMQITGPDSTHAYAYWPTFNKDSTKLYVFRENDEGPAFYDFDPVNFELGARTPEPAFESTCGNEDAMWSGVSADVIHCHDGDGTIYAYNVVTNAITPIKTLPGVAHMFQMTRDLAGNVFGFRLQNADFEFIGWVTYHRTTDITKTRLDGNIDEIKLDKTGRYIVEGKQTFPPGGSGIQTTVEDRRTGERTDLTDGFPDYAPGHGDTPTGKVIGHDDWENRLLERDLDTPHDFTSLLQWDNFRQDYHGSAIADDESWFLVSAYGTLTGPLASEIFQVKTDGSGGVRHLAHTFSSESSRSTTTPRAPRSAATASSSRTSATGARGPPDTCS